MKYIKSFDNYNIKLKCLSEDINYDNLYRLLSSGNSAYVRVAFSIISGMDGDYDIEISAMLRKYPKICAEFNVETDYLAKFNEIRWVKHHGDRMPDGIVNYINAKSIFATNSGLVEINPIIGTMDNVVNIRMERNNISEIPNSLGNLKNLTNLDISKNNISKIPNSLGNLKKLKTLNLSYNNISEIPNSLGNLKSLTTLDLSYNNISKILESIGKLSNLEELKLYGTQIDITEIPESISKLKKLKRLSIGHDNMVMTSIPTYLSNIDYIVMPKKYMDSVDNPSGITLIQKTIHNS